MTKPLRVFDADTIELCVRWYITYRLSYRDFVELMAERGVTLARSPRLRELLRYVPEYDESWNRTARPDRATRRRRSGASAHPLLPHSGLAYDRIAMQLAPRIVADPEICHGQAVVAGTRVAVAILVGSVAAGMPIAAVAREYDITEADVRAALEYAAKLASGESFHPLPAA